MKKNILLLTILSIPLLISAQITKNRKYISVPYNSNIKTISFTVLDINCDKQLLAFKHIYKLSAYYDGEGNPYNEPYDCKYSGMQKYPYAGVVLGVYDLSEQKYSKTFTVYNAAGKQSECTSYEQSKTVLKVAKEYFKKNNLDITQKPTPEQFSITDNIQTLEINNLVFKAEYEKTDEDEILSTLSVYDKETKQTKKLYIIKQEDDFITATLSKVEYISAYVKDEKIVFLTRFYHLTGMSGAETEIYHFTPIFELNNIFTAK